MPPPRTSLDPEGHYTRLGLNATATQAAISAAYRAKARLLHPDVPRTGNAAAFLAIKQAYDILSNREKRESYDRKARQAELDAIQPTVFVAPRSYAAPVEPTGVVRFFDLPLMAWLGFGAFLSLCMVEVVLHLRAEPQVERKEIRPNAVTVQPLSPSAHQAVLYGPLPARLPGTPNFYVVPAAGPTILWRLDQQHNTLVPLAQLPLFSSVQVVRLYRQNGLLEVLVSDHQNGFVQIAHLTPGNADAAHRAYCGYNAGPTPADGEVLERHGNGGYTLQVDNRAVQPAVVKLREATGTVAFAIFLAPGGHADLAGVPSAAYRAEYAIGELWSRACNTFAAGMRARRLDAAYTIPDNGHLVVPDDNGNPASDIPDHVFERK